MDSYRTGSNSKQEGKRSLKEKEKIQKEMAIEEEGDEEEEGEFEDDKKKRAAIPGAAPRKGSNGGNLSPACCQAEKCPADLTEAKRYYRRHKVCEQHSKAPVVIIAGLQQRFCQQCSRFHELSEFDEAKRSCRSRLAGHNERRRKNSSETHGEGTNHKGVNPQLKENLCRQADQTGRIQITQPGNSTFKHFQIR